MARKPPGKGHPARPSCRAASPRRRPAAPAPPTHPGTGPQSRAALGWFSVTKHWKPLPGTSRGSAQEGGPSGNVWQPVSPGRGSRAGASRVLPDGPSASSRRDPIWPASSEPGRCPHVSCGMTMIKILFGTARKSPGAAPTGPGPRRCAPGSGVASAVSGTRCAAGDAELAQLRGQSSHFSSTRRFLRIRSLPPKHMVPSPVWFAHL